MVSSRAQSENGLGLGSVPGADSQGADPAFEVGHTLLENIAGGVHNTSINVAGLLQGKQPGGMIGVIELVRGSLVYRDCPRPGGGIGFLTGMNLAGIETVLVRGISIV
jgi:hypothetical protein